MTNMLSYTLFCRKKMIVMIRIHPLDGDKWSGVETTESKTEEWLTPNILDADPVTFKLIEKKNWKEVKKRQQKNH